MEWLEIIELRILEKDRELMEPLLKTLSKEISAEDPNQIFKMYRRMVPHIDFSIHLFHESETVEYNGSKMGLHLSAILKTYGIVRHSIWNSLQDTKQDVSI